MAVMTVEPIKSQQDHKSYKRLKLDNGLDVLLIRDPEMEASSSAHSDAHMTSDDEHLGTGSDASSLQGSSEADDESMDGNTADRQHVKKAAAAMAVGVGSFSDPDDVPGMSHYLEHMLFMGSEKFPDENDYDSYLQHHGGSSNAYTEMEYTNYYFDCKPAALHGALDRFAQFFVAPLCKADALEREVNAVDNEFSGVQQDDGSRLAQLRCHTAKEGHIFRKFTWGNRKSLVDIPASKGIDIRSELVQYYKNNYSAERMVLVLLGGEPLETLEQWVRELFLGVPSGRGPRPTFDHLGRPYTGGRLHVAPAVRQGHSLTLTVQLPSLFHAYRAKPEDYVSHLVGHEGAGSLLSALKARGWASAISAGVNENGFERNSALFVFEITITLTEAGLHQSPGLGLATVPLVFSYLEMLRQAGPQRWVFKELAAVSEQRFRFAEDEEASEYVSRLAASLPLYAPEHALNGSYVHDEWRPDLVTDILECMRPSNCRLDLQSSAFEDLKKTQQLLSDSGCVASTEPWFDLPYVELPLHADTLRAWEQPPASSAEGLALPQRNHFIPTDFALKSEAAGSAKGSKAKQAAEALLTAAPAQSAKADNGHAASNDNTVQPLEDPPDLIADAPGLQIWHKLDRTFQRPIAVAYLSITPRTAYNSPKTAALTHLVLKLLQDDVCETTYLADVAGLQYDAWPEGLAGMELKVNGFSHKLPLLLEQLVKAMVSLKVDPGAFVRNREALVQKYQNANMSPERHASYLRLRALKQRMWRMEDVLAELQALTPASVQEALHGLLKDTHVTALVQGNFTAQEAFEMASSVRKMLSNGVLMASDRSADRVAVLPQGTLLHRAPVKNAEEANSVTELYCQVGPNSIAQRARLDMLEQLVSEPFYDTLRTKEQLGYSVHCSTRLTHGILGFALVVVSGGHGPAHLHRRIDAFLEGLAGNLSAISEAEFEGHREALIAAKLQKDHALGDEADRNWEQISSRRYDFLAREEEVAELRVLTLDDVKQTYQTFLKPTSKEACRLSVHVVGKAHAQELDSPAEPVLGSPVPEISEFQSLEHYPAILGHMPPVAQG